MIFRYISLMDVGGWLFNFFWVDVSMTKKINHRGHGGHRALLFSLCPLCSLWFFQNPFQNITKSLVGEHLLDFYNGNAQEIKVSAFKKRSINEENKSNPAC